MGGDGQRHGPAGTLRLSYSSTWRACTCMGPTMSRCTGRWRDAHHAMACVQSLQWCTSCPCPLTLPPRPPLPPQVLPVLKQYLILYSSISTAKLASLLEVEEGSLRTTLLAIKTKSQGLRWGPGRGSRAVCSVHADTGTAQLPAAACTLPSHLSLSQGSYRHTLHHACSAT